MPTERFKNNTAIRFGISFIVLFVLFYYANIYFFGLTLPGNHYNAFLADYLNYVAALRWVLLSLSSKILNALGFVSIFSTYELLVVGHNVVRLVYTCLGLGVMSFFAAFVISYPKKLKPKLLFLFIGLTAIQVLNICRIILLALYWNRSKASLVDHHFIFDVVIYIVIAIGVYFWVNHQPSNRNASN